MRYPWWGSIAVVVVAVGTLLPWPAAGAADVSGFDFAGTLADLGRILGLPGVRAVAVAWYLVPAAVAATLVAAGLGTRGPWVIAAAVDISAALISVATIWAATRTSLDGPYLGPVAVVAGGLVAAAAAIRMLRRRA